MNWPISWNDVNNHLTETDARLDACENKINSGLTLPVVELSTELTSGATFTAEESAALTACVGSPIVLRTPSFALVMQYCYDGLRCFAGSILDEYYVLAQADDGSWGLQG